MVKKVLFTSGKKSRGTAQRQEGTSFARLFRTNFVDKPDTTPVIK